MIGRGAYYGVSFDQERIYIACRQVAYGGDKESQDNAILCASIVNFALWNIRCVLMIAQSHPLC